MDSTAIQEISRLALQASHKTDDFLIVPDSQTLTAAPFAPLWRAYFVITSTITAALTPVCTSTMKTARPWRSWIKAPFCRRFGASTAPC